MSQAANDNAVTPGPSVRSFSLVIFAIAALFISDDVLLVLQVGGSYHLRLVQLLLAVAMLPVLLSALIMPIASIRWPLGFAKLLLWFTLLTSFVWNVPPSGLTRNIGYDVWLLFDILIVFSLTNCLRSDNEYRYLLRWYFSGIAAASILGILQVGISFTGLTPPFVEQWWIPGVWARANGISYEASYFATFLIAGWIALDYLRLNKVRLYSARTSKITYAVVTCALILSTSRLGLLAMIVWWCLRTAWMLRKNEWRLGMVKLLMPTAAVVCAVVLLAQLTIIPEMLTSGIIAVETADAYSADQRTEIMLSTLQVFRQHLWFGVSLGGVAVHIANDEYVDINAGQANFIKGEVGKVEGMCVGAEVLAASGLIGFPFFALYIVGLFFTPLRFSGDGELPIVVRALCWGFLAEFLVLQFNQNILRTYLWFHIGLICAGYGLLKPGEHPRTAQYAAQPR